MSDDNKDKNGDAGNGGDDKDKNLDNPNDSKNKNNDGNGNKGDQMIPKYRLDEVSAENQKLKAEKEERERKDREAADKKLADEKKFEELATKRQQDLEKANSTVSEMRIERAVERVAVKLGAVDTEAVIKLLDKSALKFDKDGNVENAEEVVKALLEAKPFLKGSGGSPADIGGGSNPDQPSGAKKPISWVREKWADPKWVREKHEDLEGKTGEEYLNDLQAKGLIDYNS
jgi:hypothetical protein